MSAPVHLFRRLRSTILNRVMVYFYYFILPMSVKLLRIKAKMNHFLQFKKMISRRIIFVYILVLFYLYQHCKDNVETIF